MADYKTILTELSDAIFTITLNRPDRMNAFTTQMKDDVIAALDEADANDDVRAVIITGSGDRAFCAGADLGGGGDTFDYAEGEGEEPIIGEDGQVNWAHDKVRDSGGQLTLRIFNAKKPVIGAINGAAVGIGATMTLPMDFRLVSDRARFGFVFARRGIVPEAASSWFLPRLVGVSKALEWCYSGKVFGAEEAKAGGLARSIHKADDLLSAARAFATELTAESAPVSIATTRQMMWRMLGAGHPIEAHRMDSRAIWYRGKQGDAREGVQSFLEKRDAAFPDKVSKDMPDLSKWFDDPDY